MHRVKWTTAYGQKRNIVGEIIDCGEFIHLHPTGRFRQTYKIVIDKKIVDVPAKGGHFIIKNENITKIEEYPKKSVSEGKQST